MNIRHLTLAVPLTAGLALTACGSADDKNGEFHGFDTEADYKDALNTFACDLASDGTSIADAYNTVTNTPELQARYNLDALDFHDALYGTKTYDCSVDWIKAGTVQEIEDKGYFDHDYAVENGVIDE